jgi:excinuclease ABC subunit A
VEHDLDVVAASDYVIDMGPGAGEAGGAIVASGTPAEISTAARSRTGRYLKRRLNGRTTT